MVRAGAQVVASAQLEMALKLRPTLGRHWRLRDRRIYETPGGSTVCAGSDRFRHRSDDPLGSRGDLRGS
jgi:hypothetical protein